MTAKTATRKVSFLFFTTIMGGMMLAASANPAYRPAGLPDPVPEQALETLHPGVSSFAISPNQVVAVAIDGRHVLVSPFNANGKTRAERFGAMTDSQKVAIDAVPDPYEIGPVLLHEASTTIVDARSLRFYRLDNKTWTLVSRMDLPWDILRPAADRLGEATVRETEEFRARFRTALLKTGAKLSGMVAVPRAWVGGSAKRVAYIAVTRIPGFPLLTLGCDTEEEPNRCFVERGCFVSGLSKAESASLSGIGIIPGTKKLLIGLAATNQLVELDFQSCFHVVRGKTIDLPRSLKKLSHMFIDSEKRLWISTESLDDWHNASVFYWNFEQWR